MGWPGLASEVRTICEEIMIPDASRMDVEKETIQKAVRYDHMKSLKKELKGDKMKDMANTDISNRTEYTSWTPLPSRKISPKKKYQKTYS